MKTLVERKDGLIASRATPPAFLQVLHVLYPLHFVMSPSKADAAVRLQPGLLLTLVCTDPSAKSLFLDRAASQV